MIFNSRGKAKHTPGTLMAGVIGNVMEWYDFALYGYFAPFISRQFFPGSGGTADTLATWGIFAAGFLMRPIGSAIFGVIGDRFGRRIALFLSVIMMGIPTLALGLIPSYESVGIASTILLVVVRLVQGLSVGGEFSGSVTYVVETSPANRRGISGSWANVGSMAGMLLGSGLATLVTNVLVPSELQSWGWRLPFIFGGVLAAFAIYIRRNLSPSELFEQHEKNHKNRSPLKLAFSRNRKQMFQAFFMVAGYGVLFYIPLVYLPDYLNQYASINISQALRINTIVTALLLPVIPLMGFLSDRFITRKRLLLVGFGLMAALGYPLFALLLHSPFYIVLLIQFVLAMLVAVPLGTAPATMVELFPTEDRLTGYSISYNLAAGVIGGTTPFVSTWLIAQTGSSLAPAIYLAGWALISFIAMMTMRDGSRVPLR